MIFGREEDHRVVLTDAIYHKGAEDGPCGLMKSLSDRARQIEIESRWFACQRACKCVVDLQWIDIIDYGIS